MKQIKYVHYYQHTSFGTFQSYLLGTHNAIVDGDVVHVQSFKPVMVQHSFNLDLSGSISSSRWNIQFSSLPVRSFCNSVDIFRFHVPPSSGSLRCYCNTHMHFCYCRCENSVFKTDAATESINTWYCERECGVTCLCSNITISCTSVTVEMGACLTSWYK